MCVASFAYCNSSVMTTQSRTREERKASAAAASATRPASGRLFRSDVGSGDAAVHEERRAGDRGRLVAREQEGRVHELSGSRKATGRYVNEPAPRGLRILAPDPLQQRRLDRARTEGVDADALSRELHTELAAEREHRALRRSVGDLRGRR